MSWRDFLPGRGIARLSAERLCRRLTLEGWEHLHEAAAEGRGAVLLNGDADHRALVERVVEIYGDEAAQGPLEVFEDPAAAARRAAERGVTLLRLRVHPEPGGRYRVVLGQAVKSHPRAKTPPS